MYTFNDLLVAWLVFKGRVHAPQFNVMDWIDQIHSAISVGHEEKAEDQAAINAELENHLISAMVDGLRTGHWPWTD